MNISPDRAERLAAIRLARTDGVGASTFFRILERCGSAVAALDALPRLTAATGRALRPIPEAAALDELAAHERLGARLVVWGEPDYPPRLAATADPPPLLSVRGDVGLLAADIVAIVGARNASAAGRRIAEQIAADLGRAGIVVASGFARGIDSAAHRGALETGTVAAIAGGVDVVYPPENDRLYAAVVESGAVVAELPPGTEPRARHFPRRNRVIAGLALGVVVVEAALKSGSLITARIALEEGRDLFAVPGSPLDPRCRGSNDLLRDRAHLTETADDVLQVVCGALGIVRRRELRRPRMTSLADVPAQTRPAGSAGAAPGDDGDRLAVIEALGPTPVTVDEVVRRCQLTAATVSSVLLDLELSGRLERHPGQRVSLI